MSAPRRHPDDFPRGQSEELNRELMLAYGSITFEKGADALIALISAQLQRDNYGPAAAVRVNLGSAAEERAQNVDHTLFEFEALSLQETEEDLSLSAETAAKIFKNPGNEVYEYNRESELMEQTVAANQLRYDQGPLTVDPRAVFLPSTPEAVKSPTPEPEVSSSQLDVEADDRASQEDSDDELVAKIKGEQEEIEHLQEELEREKGRLATALRYAREHEDQRKFYLNSIAKKNLEKQALAVNVAALQKNVEDLQKNVEDLKEIVTARAQEKEELYGDNVRLQELVHELQEKTETTFTAGLPSPVTPGARASQKATRAPVSRRKRQRVGSSDETEEGTLPQPSQRDEGRLAQPNTRDG
ncbi:hypothetical protein FA95DRAFT_1593509 [Auriscalpium vulgare]|uniref:Uncharacterized protein n=1 Tax=Auriscalpium vulgare TaxID=40419 RepID=A0ACB8S4N2_9AGAM|nr:hypothetical protein FA95DRAFT_1593509 [Auriscalpium vulgare]